MPLNVRRFYTSVLLVIAFLIVGVNAQTVPASVASTAPSAAVPTSGDMMRERISKAKAYIAVRNYNAAIYELENLRRETSDSTVQAVVNVLLMNSYLEQGDFKRAQELLNQSYAIQKTTKPDAQQIYNAVAGQVVKGARDRAERYRALGLSVSDRTLPLEAANDLEKMRESLEIVITQAKEIAKDPKKTSDAMMLVEEASTSRSMLGRDDYDARRWQENVADAREEIASSRTIVTDVVNDAPTVAKPEGTQTPSRKEPVIVATAAVAPPSQPSTVLTNRSATPSIREREVKPVSEISSKIKDPVAEPAVAKNTPEPVKTATAEKAEPKPQPSDEPLNVGSLVAYATRQTSPVYPSAARSSRMTGLVKVELTVDENGNVAEVQNASGPIMLQAAAKDAVRNWKFRPFFRDGQPVKAVGYVSFNFAL